MRCAMLWPLACLVLRAGDAWGEAQAMLKAKVEPGHVGCLVYVERLGGSTLRLYLVASGTRFMRVEGEPMGRPDLGFKLQAPKGSGDLRLVTEVPEGASQLRLRAVGEDFSPELVLHLPKAGEAEGTVLQVEGPSAERKASSR